MILFFYFEIRSFFLSCSFFEQETHIEVQVLDLWSKPVQSAIVSVPTLSVQRVTNESGIAFFPEEQLYPEGTIKQNFRIQAPNYMVLNHQHVHQQGVVRTQKFKVNIFSNVPTEGLYSIGSSEYEKIEVTQATQVSTDMEVFTGFQVVSHTPLTIPYQLLFRSKKKLDLELHPLHKLPSQSIKKDKSIVQSDLGLYQAEEPVSYSVQTLSQKRHIFNNHSRDASKCLLCSWGRRRFSSLGYN